MWEIAIVCLLYTVVSVCMVYVCLIFRTWNLHCQIKLSEYINLFQKNEVQRVTLTCSAQSSNKRPRIVKYTPIIAAIHLQHRNWYILVISWCWSQIGSYYLLNLKVSWGKAFNGDFLSSNEYVNREFFSLGYKFSYDSKEHLIKWLMDEKATELLKHK